MGGNEGGEGIYLIHSIDTSTFINMEEDESHGLEQADEACTDLESEVSIEIGNEINKRDNEGEIRRERGARKQTALDSVGEKTPKARFRRSNIPLSLAFTQREIENATQQSEIAVRHAELYVDMRYKNEVTLLSPSPLLALLSILIPFASGEGDKWGL